MYTILYGNPVKKDIKSLPKNVINKIIDLFDNLQKNPYIGKKLHGEFKEYFSSAFIVRKVEYRIIYTVNEKELIIYIVKAGTRENIYKELKRRV